MKLKDIHDISIKTYTPLYALTPIVHQKLYNLCAPNESLPKTYKELLGILKTTLSHKPAF